MGNKKRTLHTLRRHTFHFLEQAREVQPIYLSMDVDALRIKESRAAYKQSNISVSYISYLILAISKAIEKFPEVNTYVQGKWFPKHNTFDHIYAKFTMDKIIENQRIVVSSVIPNSNEQSIYMIQKYIEQKKLESFQEGETFESVRKLQKFPVWIGGILYRIILKKVDKRLETQGSFTVTSLGHLPVQQFFPITSNTTCFGTGAITDKLVVKGGRSAIVPILPLSMTFDHRAIDGALAAEFLYEVKINLENWEDQKWQDDRKNLSMMS